MLLGVTYTHPFEDPVFTKAMRPVWVTVGYLLAVQLGASLLTTCVHLQAEGHHSAYVVNRKEEIDKECEGSGPQLVKEHSVNASGGGDYNDYQY